jgi:activating signal cointegrator complex subunit 3
MATMNKPAYNHIKKYSDGKPVIIFVSSRRQTRLTANDLIAYSQMDNKDKCPYVLTNQKEIQEAIEQVHDDYLKSTLSFGIVMHHAGLDTHDR